MGQTYEERIARELDELYRGSLFLSCGDEDAAATLLVECATTGFHEHAARDTERPFDRWIHTLLVRVFLKGARLSTVSASGSQPAFARPTAGESGVLGFASLSRRAETVPVRARAALWLVALLRWNYDEVSDALDLDRDELVALLGHRSTLAHANRSGRASGSRTVVGGG